MHRLVFNKYQCHIDVSNKDSLEKWIINEQKAWSSMDAFLIDNSISSASSNLNMLNNVLDYLFSNKDSVSADHMKEIESRFFPTLENYMPSGSKIGRNIIDLFTFSPPFGAVLYIFFNEGELSEYVMRILSDKIGSSYSYYNLGITLRDHLGEIDKHASEQLEQARRVINSVINFRDKAISETESLLRKHNKDLDTIKEQYIASQSLSAPAEHWIGKSKRHRKNARLWLSSSISVLLFSIFSSIYLFYWSFDNIIILNSTLTGKNINTPVFIFIVSTSFFLIISIFRLLSKQYREEQRMADDAEQRHTMMSTYLSLLAYGSDAISPNEKLLILHALFRGSAYLENSEDIPPVNMIDAIVNSLRK